MFNIYVGNVSFDTTEAKLRELFSEHGEVERVNMIADRDTGRFRGFGFVEMASDDAGRSAIEALNGREVDGRTLTVNEARSRGASAGRGGGGGGRRYGG